MDKESKYYKLAMTFYKENATKGMYPIIQDLAKLIEEREKIAVGEFCQMAANENRLEIKG